MFRITLTAAAIALGSVSLAQTASPGAHFIENWDLNEDGQVPLVEATERRSDIFASFDSDDSGQLDGEEYALFDEARANDMRENGIGKGHQGKGKGKGRNGQGSPADGMMRQFTDLNGDGTVSQDEFMTAVPGWFARLDRNGDSVVTVADFGNGH